LTASSVELLALPGAGRAASYLPLSAEGWFNVDSAESLPESVRLPAEGKRTMQMKGEEMMF
jgi:hypothetical protein